MDRCTEPSVSSVCLAEPDIEPHAEGLEIGPDIGKHGILAVVGELPDAFLEGDIQKASCRGS